MHAKVLCSAVHSPGRQCLRCIFVICGSVVQHAMAGLAGMVGAMLLETWLYIIRTNFEPHLHGKAPTGRHAARSQRASSAAAQQPLAGIEDVQSEQPDTQPPPESKKTL